MSSFFLLSTAFLVPGSTLVVRTVLQISCDSDVATHSVGSFNRLFGKYETLSMSGSALRVPW